MATVKGLITAEAFAGTGPETDGCELVRGEVLRMPPPGDRHGYVCGNVVFLLKSYLKQLGYGALLCNDAGIITRREPDSVRGVDAAVFLRPPWEGALPPIGYTSAAPDLVVEVRSPEQRWKDIVEKVAEYLGVGARSVWVIDPQAQRVTAFSPDQEPRTFAPENDLDGGAFLPGFQCRVSDFFA
jgi:Uma2 family endonuclease